MTGFIPLLSKKPLSEFTPEEFKLHVNSLKTERRVRRKEIKIRPPFVAKLTKTGKPQIKVNRDPKWLSESEMEEISRSLSVPLSDIFIYMKKRQIRRCSPEEALETKIFLEDMPF